MEDAATAVVRHLRDAFVPREAERSELLLARAFHTAAGEDLPEDLRRYVAERSPGPTRRCLVLIGTDGDEPAWRDRRTSRDHRAIPLSDADALASVPMVAALVEHFGVDLDTFLHGSEPPDSADARDDFEVFYVPDAAGAPEVPAQDFVTQHGVRSVLGFGGVLPGGHVFAFILFARTRIPEHVAAKFSAVAVAAKLALLAAVEGPLLAGQPERPADPLAVARARNHALEQMLSVRHRTIVDQAARLEDALAEALRARAQAEREVEVNQALHRITLMLSAELDLDRLVQGATDAATQVTGAAFGAFFYNALADDGESYTLYTISGVPRSAFEGFPMPRATAVFRPTFRGEGVLRSADITEDPRFGHNEPYHGMPEGHLPVRSYLAVPVVARSGEVHGGFFFGHPEPGVFDEAAERLAVGIAAQTAIALDNARLYQAERRTALALQRSLLPQEVAAPEGLEIAYEYSPGGSGTDVGGDWFDVIPLAGGRTAFVIGDVMGKGVHAAAVMGQLRTAIRAYTVLELPPRDLIGQLNNLVLDMGDDLIATCTYAVLDQAENTLTVASAGHMPPAFIRSGGGVALLDLTLGPPLGVPGALHQQHQVDFPVGTRMLLFTDGLVENRDRSLEDGLAQLHRQLTRMDGDSTDACRQVTTGLLAGHDQDDDVTVMLVSNTGLPRQDYARRHFQPEPRQASEARRFVASTLGRWGDDDYADPIVLAVNELFINAITHASTPVTMELRRLPSVILAEVGDLDGHFPRRTHALPSDEHFRGLEIVETVATRWGARPTESGKIVWAEFSTEFPAFAGV